MSSVTVLSGPEGRRRWTDQQKAQIVEESFATGAIVAAVARRHDVNANQLHHWRRQVREEGSGGSGVGARFVPVEIAPSPPAVSMSLAGSSPSVPARRTRSGLVEIEVCGCRIRVDRDVDKEALGRVIDVLVSR